MPVVKTPTVPRNRSTMKHDEHESGQTSDMSSDLKAELDPMRSPGAWMQAFAAGFMSSEVGTNDADDGEAIVASWMERARAGLEPIVQVPRAETRFDRAVP